MLKKVMIALDGSTNVIKEAILNIEINKVKQFLASFDLSYEDSIDKTLYIEDNDKIISKISKETELTYCPESTPSCRCAPTRGYV